MATTIVFWRKWHRWIGFPATLFLLFTALKSAVTDRGRKPGIFDFGLLAICVTISSPVAWEHHYGIMLPLLVIALAALTTRGRDPQPDTGTALLIASWVLIGNYFAFLNVFKSSWLNVLQSPMLAGGLLLALLYLKLQGAERKQQASHVPDTGLRSGA